MDSRYVCIVNGCDLRDEPIPEEHRSSSGVTHYNKRIGYEIQGYYDGVSMYHCPVCEANWCRFTDTVVKDARELQELKLGRPDSGTLNRNTKG